MFPINDILKGLGIVDPFERTEAVGDRHNTESFYMQVSVHAGRIISKYSIHDLEELLHTLVQT